LLVHSSAMQDTLTIRIDAALKREVEKKATERDETISQVVRRALRNYVFERDFRAGRTPEKNSSRK
jgi:predicted transcriptional regulator